MHMYISWLQTAPNGLDSSTGSPSIGALMIVHNEFHNVGLDSDLNRVLSVSCPARPFRGRHVFLLTQFRSIQPPHLAVPRELSRSRDEVSPPLLPFCRSLRGRCLCPDDHWHPVSISHSPFYLSSQPLVQVERDSVYTP